ncbi:MAG: hypothetical protein IKM39_02660 [Clostridia bacterium]|nr:hypothetical protein [Clostridia bacterium]
MKPFLEVSYPLRACDFDYRKQLQPASVLDLFQDAAGRHSVELGIGIEQLLKKNQLWIVSSIYYEVINTPDMYQQVKVRTWPLTPSMVVFPREYVMEDGQGNVLVKGTSQWAVIDKDRRKILPAKGIYPEGFNCLDERVFCEKQPRLRDFEPVGEGYTVLPSYSQLDCNGHVNNTKYANFVLDALQLPEGTCIRTFQIHYRKELLLGDPVILYTRCEDGMYDVMGKNSEGESMFHCRITV